MLGKEDDGDYEIVNPVDDVTGWVFSPPSRCIPPSSMNSNEDSDGPSSNINSNDDSKIIDNCADAWESFELINHYLRHSLHHGLGINDDMISSHPLILLDKSHTPPPIRQRSLEVLFEQNSLPAVFMLRDAIAACYAVGRTTATVVDCGHNSTTVTPVYEGFVEKRGVRRNNACGSRHVDYRILENMDGLVVKAGRKRKDRLKRINAKKFNSNNNESSSSSTNNGGATQSTESPVKKRDAAGHFIKRSSMIPEYPIPDYLMPLYQVKRAPVYNTRSDPFHAWARLALARELREGGIGAAVGAMGYVMSTGDNGGDGAGGAAVLGQQQQTMNNNNPAFMTGNKIPFTIPDGTNVDITANARCDVAELYFGNDAYNTSYRERVLEESKVKLQQYVKDVEEYCNNWEPTEDDKKALTSIDTSSSAGDAYSNTSYRGEKSSRHGGGVRRPKSVTYSPGTISAKLFSACLPYLRTTPTGKSPSSATDHLLSTAGTSSTASTSMSTLDDERCFSYLTSAPPAQMVCDAAFRCDRDQQGALLGNVVVCGGGACLPGIGGASAAVGATDDDAFPDRLREEIEAIVHQHTLGWRVKVTSPNVSERSICSWLGGSILGSLGTFQDMWISKKDYEEYGSAIVNRKCP